MSNGTFIQSRLYRVFIFLVAILIICLGVYLTHISYRDIEWISRSGCAIVILGIWAGLGAIVQERIVMGKIKWQRRNAIITAKARLLEKGVDEERIDKEIGEINQAFSKQAENLTQNLKYSLGTLEVILLIAGTFLWGFGDLFI